MQLEGKRILVTGGAQGIGAAIVKAYSVEGATVCSYDLNEEGVGRSRKTRATRGREQSSSRVSISPRVLLRSFCFAVLQKNWAAESTLL